MANTPNTTSWNQTSLAKMPKLMRNSGCPKAAQMQERWFNSARLSFKQTAGSDNLQLDCRIISSQWLRAQRGTRMIKHYISEAENGLRNGGLDYLALTKIAREALGKGWQRSSASFPVGGLKKLNNEVSTLHGKAASKRDSIEKWAYRTMKCNANYGTRATSWFKPDDVDAALGVFYFWVIPSGTVTKIGNQLQITIDEIGWCVFDSFDYGKGFADDQVLGMWDFDNMNHSWLPFSKHNGLGYRLKNPAFGAVNGNWWIFNSTYRAFQVKWRRGEDFAVLSDIGVEKLRRPISASFASR